MDQNVNAPRSVVYCPRTHAFFGHSPHPFRELQTHGINVALGTDSLASNPDLSILAEMRFLRRKYPKMPGKMLLEMGTLAGARALGWSHDVGSLTPGKHADFIAIPVEDSASEPHEAILRSDAPVSGVWINGMKV
jgi:cytosine/adenosine deaminase-related metal-dependent hydrolase